MVTNRTWILLFAAALSAATLRTSAAVRAGGELKLWHKVTLTMDGPQAKETEAARKVL